MGTKVFDNALDLITFTRASSATYLDSDGLLKTASTNVPRIEYDATGAVKGLLVEEARTNLLLRSEEFDDAAWTKSELLAFGSGSVANTTATTDPAGGNSAELIVENTNTGIHRVSQSHTNSLTTITVSVYVKAASGSRFIGVGPVSSTSAGNNRVSVFDLSTEQYLGDVTGGTFLVGTSSNQTITAVGSGWYRLSVTANKNAGVAASFAVWLLDSFTANATLFGSYAGDGTSGIYVWGAQLEEGAFPTSYIPTAGATATRAADIASIPVSAFGYNPGAGSLVMEARTTTAPNVNFARLGTQSSFDNGVDFQASAGNVSAVFWFNNTSQASYTGPVVASNTTYKFAAAIEQNNTAFAINGSTGGTDTSCSVLPAVTLLLGDKDQTDLFGACHIRSVSYYPRRLSNAQLQELTS